MKLHIIHIFEDIEPQIDNTTYTSWEALVKRARYLRYKYPDDGLYWYEPKHGPIELNTFSGSVFDNLEEEFEVDDEEFDEEQYLQNAELILDSARGVYIPRDFWEMWPTQLSITPVISKDNLFALTTILPDPDHPEYWEAWEGVLNLDWEDSDKKKFELYQSEHGDLWLVPKDK